MELTDTDRLKTPIMADNQDGVFKKNKKLENIVDLNKLKPQCTYNSDTDL